jgi:hypothetical protein
MNNIKSNSYPIPAVYVENSQAGSNNTPTPSIAEINKSSESPVNSEKTFERKVSNKPRRNNERPLSLGLKSKILELEATCKSLERGISTDSSFKRLFELSKCSAGTVLPNDCEKINYISGKGLEFPITVKAYPGDPQYRRLAANSKTGKLLTPPIVLKKIPSENGFVWMHAEAAGLKGGEPSFSTFEDACAYNGNAYIVALSTQGPFEVVDRNTNEQLGHFWASATEDNNTVYFPSIENDSGIKGGTDIAIWAIAKGSTMSTMKIGCVTNSDLREMLKDKYKMECNDTTLDCTGNRSAMLKEAKKRLNKNGWNLIG